DVISQTLLALPMWILFEIGVFFSRIIKRDKERREAADEGEQETGSSGSTAPEKPAPAAPAAAAFVTDPAFEMDDSPLDLERFTPLTEEELDAELDIIEAEESEAEDEDEESGDLGESDDDGMYDDIIDEKLRRVQALRDEGEEVKARGLLYEILGEANEEQAKVARNILDQLDEDY
ncbi:MAG: twin-arginine translocase subunit TatC, partial [Sedimenticola sp.]|nr:twin-arginine translocase subunit TatC [Sedimenticola sp.]